MFQKIFQEKVTGTDEHDLVKHLSNIGAYIYEKLTLDPELLAILLTCDLEIEVEREQRVEVEIAQGFVEPEWNNDVVDIYDDSGTVRIRSKRGIVRIGVKIPIPELNSFRAKACIRIEIKSKTDEQQAVFKKIHEDLAKKPGVQIYKKRGGTITLKDGRQVWLNSNGEKYWIDIDDPTFEIEHHLPDGLTYVRHQKSIINSSEAIIYPFDEYKQDYRTNLVSTSRSANGTLDTSVSTLKEWTSLNANELKAQVTQNSDELSDLIWNLRSAPILSTEALIAVLTQIATKVNQDIQPLKLRDWEVKYGKKVPPGSELDEELTHFFNKFFLLLRMAEKEEITPYTLACWIEYQTDSQLHAFADGCGRIAKAWAAFVLLRLEQKLPNYRSRDEYYAAMNGTSSDFYQYYMSTKRQ